MLGRRCVCARCLFALLLPWGAAASATTLYEQALDSWATGWCSPCGAEGLDFRVFASFRLEGAATLEEAAFAILDHTIAGGDDINVSIWDAPRGNVLFAADFAEDTYTRQGTESTHWAVVKLPDWTLPAGTYWISLYGLDGNYLSWGSDHRRGDDVHVLGDGEKVSEERYVGFRLSGREIASLPGSSEPVESGSAPLVDVSR